MFFFSMDARFVATDVEMADMKCFECTQKYPLLLESTNP